jgi:hypothetical protein
LAWKNLVLSPKGNQRIVQKEVAAAETKPAHAIHG